MTKELSITELLKMAAEAGVNLPHSTNTNATIDFPATTPKLKHTKGNLLDLAEAGEYNIIVQGCNCFHTMGSGIAREIRTRYPHAYDADCMQTIKGDRDKVGKFSIALGKQFNIINAYTQYSFNAAGKNVDVFEYAGFQTILDTLALQYPGCKFGFPYIGMGLAGGDKVRIMAMLENFAQKVTATNGSATLVEFG